MPPRPLLVLVLLLGAWLATACDGESDSGNNSDHIGEEADDDGLFWGTPVDYAEALADCYERQGVATDPDPNDPRMFATHWGPMTGNERQEIRDRCDEEIGVWTPDTVPEGYVEEQYEHRLWQRECLIELGHELSDPPSFEAYAEHLDWNPLTEAASVAGLRGHEFQDLERECPRLHQWEAQQERS